MKTILYNPIFINPQAYYVFPRLTRWLRPDDSYKEPANYIGQIEVTIIAYGEIGYTEYFEHTNYIDFTNFSNSYVRISLFTRLGSCVLGEWKIGAMESDRPYIEPEVLASLKAVVIVGDKTNQDKDRDTVANLVDASNPFVISNAAFKLNSGFGKYETELSDTKIWTQSKETTSTAFSSSYNGLSGWIIFANTELTNSADMPSFKIQVKGLLEGQELIYRYYDSAGQSNVYSMAKDGEYTLPADIRTAKPLVSNTSGLQVVKNENNIITITQIPSFEGAFVTDGIDDLITSTKTVQEMGITDEVTVVSMIHQIALNPTYNVGTTNYLENLDNGKHIRSDVYYAGKTGIYGYTASLINNTASDIKNILGDKADYSTQKNEPSQTLHNSKFSVVGRARNLTEPSSVAWYWTIIANKVLTTDQINQVIAYFNLDRTLNPDILCNTIKQGITNENHAEFGDKLIDFSGNGRDIQLNNLAWKGGSGIAAKQYETFKDWTNTPYQTSTVTEIDEFTRVVDSTSNAYWVSMINRTSDFDKVHDSINIVLYQDDMLLVHECKYKIDENVTTKALYETLKSGVNTITLATIDKFTDIPEDAEIMSLGEWVNPKSNKGSVKITLLPSYEGGVLLDGINDFGKVTGMPIYKDYTFIIDREIISIGDTAGVVASKSEDSTDVNKQGAFLFEYLGAPNNISAWSFYKDNGKVANTDFTRGISYQSTYSYNGKDLTIGTSKDSDKLWLGTIRDNDSRFFNGAIYSLMSFPYSMSEFLIERQLKKHKLGTLYPDMVEFRPIVKSNLPYSSISYSVNPGEYISVDSMVTITVTLPNTSDKLMEVSCNAISDISISGDNGVYEITGKIVKSPQKINMIISSYLTMLSNSTLISNETLIKNE